MSNVTSGNSAPKKFCRLTGYSSYAVSRLIIIVRLCTVDSIKLIRPSKNGLSMYVIASDAIDSCVTVFVLSTNAFAAS
jgi:hypothetical protein